MKKFRMKHGKHLYQFLFLGISLGIVLTACRSKMQNRQDKPYSPIEGDTVDFEITGCERNTVEEILDSLEKDTSQESLQLREAIRKKYKEKGDSLLKKLLRGESVH